jgi:hypothetical protein
MIIKYLFLLLAMGVVFETNAQKQKEISCTISNPSKEIINDSDYIFTIIFHNDSQESVFISPNPVFCSTINDFGGNIEIETEKLDSNCFESVFISDHMQKPHSDYTKEIYSNNRFYHKIDIRNFGCPKIGQARFRLIYHYKSRKTSKVESLESNWYYFDIVKYLPIKDPRPWEEE